MILSRSTGLRDGSRNALADNDVAAFHRFTEQTEVLHGQLHEAFFNSLFTGSRLNKDEYDHLPRFSYRRSPLPVSILAWEDTGIQISLFSIILPLLRHTHS
ncbi:DUF3526 domain-containing protein [Puia sp.]|uniref:DUF3526 domain-containing protein n=1 Tax=Puia sp. TaxID=2045100 RepID=UPI0039C984CB